MAYSGDRVQIVLSAKDEITDQVNESKKALRGMERELSALNRKVREGDSASAQAYEAKRRAYDDEARKLDHLRSLQGRAKRDYDEMRKAAETANRRVSSTFDSVARRIGMSGTAVDRVTGRIRNFEVAASRAFARVESRVRSLRTSLESSGMLGWFRGAAISLGLIGGAAVAMGLKTSAQLENSAMALQQFTGSARETAQLMQWIKQTAAETPFELTDLTAATQKLLAYGFSIDETKKKLITIGDVAAGTGLGAEAISRVTMALGQMQAKQKIQSEEMRQLTEAGIPAWQLLADKMGLSVAELQDMVATAGGGNRVFKDGGLDMLFSGLDEQYGGLMKKQSRTLSGRFSTLKDTFSTGMADVLKSTGINKGLKGFMKSLTDGLGGAFKSLKKVIMDVKPAFVGFVNFMRDNPEIIKAVAVAVGVLTVAVAALAIAFAATGIPLVIWGVTALIAALAYLYFKFEIVRKVVNAFAKAVVGYIKFVWRAWSKVFQAIGALVGWLKDKALPAVVTFAKGMWDRFKMVRDKIGAAVQWIKDKIAGIWDGLTSGLRDKVEAVKELLTSLFPGIGSLPWFFAGGPVSAGTRGVVGEIGPELFVPTQGAPQLVGRNGAEVRDFAHSGVIIPAHLTASLVGGTSGGSVGGAAPVSVAFHGDIRAEAPLDVEGEVVRGVLRAQRIAAERSA